MQLHLQQNTGELGGQQELVRGQVEKKYDMAVQDFTSFHRDEPSDGRGKNIFISSLLAENLKSSTLESTHDQCIQLQKLKEFMLEHFRSEDLDLHSLKQREKYLNTIAAAWLKCTLYVDPQLTPDKLKENLFDFVKKVNKGWPPLSKEDAVSADSHDDETGGRAACITIFVQKHDREQSKEIALCFSSLGGDLSAGSATAKETGKELWTLNYMLQMHLALYQCTEPSMTEDKLRDEARHFINQIVASKKWNPAHFTCRNDHDVFYCSGKVVKIEGLSSQTQYNGQVGTLLSPFENPEGEGKSIVKLDNNRFLLVPNKRIFDDAATTSGLTFFHQADARGASGHSCHS